MRIPRPAKSGSRNTGRRLDADPAIVLHVLQRINRIVAIAQQTVAAKVSQAAGSIVPREAAHAMIVPHPNAMPNTACGR